MSAVLAPSYSPPHALAARKPRRVLPGFGLSLGVTLVYLSLTVMPSGSSTEPSQPLRA